MIKCIVKHGFNINEESLKKYGEITNIVRATAREKLNEYFLGDTFECSKKMVDYLQKENVYTKKENKPLIDVVEIIPVILEESEKEEDKKITVKKTTKKTTKK